MDESPAGHNVQAEATQNQKGPSPGVLFHQQLEERIESKGGEANAGEPQSQCQGAPPGEISHDCSYHGGEDKPPAQTWRRVEEKKH